MVQACKSGTEDHLHQKCQIQDYRTGRFVSMEDNFTEAKTLMGHMRPGHSWSKL